MPAALCAIMLGQLLGSGLQLSYRSRARLQSGAGERAGVCDPLHAAGAYPNEFSAEGMLHSAEPAVERSAATGTNANTLSGALSLESISYGVAQQ